MMPFGQLEPFPKAIAVVMACVLAVCIPAYCAYLLTRKRR